MKEPVVKPVKPVQAPPVQKEVKPVVTVEGSLVTTFDGQNICQKDHIGNILAEASYSGIVDIIDAFEYLGGYLVAVKSEGNTNIVLRLNADLSFKNAAILDTDIASIKCTNRIVINDDITLNAKLKVEEGTASAVDYLACKDFNIVKL